MEITIDKWTVFVLFLLSIPGIEIICLEIYDRIKNHKKR
jgi:hypothetical protein